MNRKAYYRQYHNALLKCEVYAQKQFYKALNAQFRIVYNDLPKKGLAQLLADLPSLIQQAPMQKAIKDTYQYTANIFHNFTKDNAPKQKKQSTTSFGAGFLDPIFIAALEAFMAKQGAAQATGITETTRSTYNAILTEAVRDRLTIPQIVKKLKDAGLKNKARAINIARTETTIAANFTQFATAQSLEITLDKIWISARDNRTRDAHRAMDGQRKPMNEPFIVNGTPMKHPGDVAGGAKNVCNCRCTTGFVAAAENSPQQTRAGISVGNIAAIVAAFVATQSNPNN